MVTAAERQRVVRCLALDVVTAEVVTALRQADVEPVLLKGPATVRWLYSEDPSVRLYTDVDLLVSPAAFARSATVMTSLGFTDRVAGLRSSEAEHRYEHVWDRQPGEMVELHRSFFGIGDPDAFWDLAGRHTDPLDVGGVVVRAPDRALGALLYALHAAQHGTERSLSAKPLEDLRRAVATFGPAVWEQAADLAREADALEPFQVGLGLDPEGARIAVQLGLTGAVAPDFLLRAHGPQVPGDRRIAEFALGGGRGRWQLVLDILFPSPGVLASRSPLVRQGAVGFTLAYLRRWYVVLTGLPSVVRAWRRSVHAARDTGWRREVTGRRRRAWSVAGLAWRFLQRPSISQPATAWWSVRALHAARAQLVTRGPEELVLPPVPARARRARQERGPSGPWRRCCDLPASSRASCARPASRRAAYGATWWSG